MTTMFALEPVDLDQALRLRHHVHHSLVVRAPADRVFEVLATGERQTAWARDYRRTTWYGTGPHGEGTVRDIHLRWIVTRERFLAWQPGRRFAFCADAMSVPLARSLVEDIQITDTSTDTGPRTCRLDWHVHYTPALALRPIGALLHERVFTPLFHDFAAGLAGYADRHPGTTDARTREHP